ncbi:hypothetical protein B7494_g6428 [Chlorociboria aeruginascens]|nr:hypothetical protein B7494_g6428 [Chlorociboria aeruginascens]
MAGVSSPNFDLELDPERNSTRNYIHTEEAECLVRYRPGDYHFVKINDILNNRYRVLFRLGYGTYSTSQLARDISTQHLVAVKVGIADANPREVDTLSKLATAFAAQNTGCTNLIPMVLDRFCIQGPNGPHSCYVRAPAKGELLYRQGGRNKGLFELDISRSLMAQVALAVEFVYGLGFFHGDFQDHSVLVQFLLSISELSDQQLYQLYGEPSTEPVVRRDGKPWPQGISHHLTLSTWLGKHNPFLGSHPARIMLADSGEPAQESGSLSITPFQYEAPKTASNEGAPLSFPSDIWSLACSAYVWPPRFLLLWSQVVEPLVARTHLEKPIRTKEQSNNVLFLLQPSNHPRLALRSSTRLSFDHPRYF